MAILKVAQMGHPVLRRRADPVPPADLRRRETQRRISDMIETMREYQGVGLAAPQVHDSRRIVIIESHGNPRHPKAPEVPLTVLVNPVITPLPGKRIEWWEGCLSIPGLTGRVSRPARIRVSALDRRGRPFTRIVEGFTAIVFQHETDHLEGILYIDRMTDLKTLSFQHEYEVHWAPAEAAASRARSAKGADA